MGSDNEKSNMVASQVGEKTNVIPAEEAKVADLAEIGAPHMDVDVATEEMAQPVAQVVPKALTPATTTAIPLARATAPTASQVPATSGHDGPQRVTAMCQRQFQPPPWHHVPNQQGPTYSQNRFDDDLSTSTSDLLKYGHGALYGSNYNVVTPAIVNDVGAGLERVQALPDLGGESSQCFFILLALVMMT